MNKIAEQPAWEIDRLRFELEHVRAKLDRSRAFVARVSKFSNDMWLASEADALLEKLS